MNRLCIIADQPVAGYAGNAGYVAALILFERLGKQEAGNIAGVLFSINNYFGLPLDNGLLVVRTANETAFFRQRQSRAEIHYPPSADRVQPILDKSCYRGTQGGHGKLAAFVIGRLFRYVAGISSIIYLVCSLLGLGLLWRYLKFENNWLSIWSHFLLKNPCLVL